VNTRHFAVVVGINRYPDIGVLQHAQRDAADFHQWVTGASGGGVPVNHAYLITADLAPETARRDAQPTRERILDALDQCIEMNRVYQNAHPADWPNTRLYFFGAGHGIAPGPRDAALLSANASTKYLNNHVSCATLLDYFSRVQHFKELIIFADCCRTEERLAAPLPPPWTDDSVNRGNVRKFFAVGARFFQRSFERLDGTPDEQRGYFTRALLDGLNGGALDPTDPTAPVKASVLKGTITEHMRRNSSARYPLRPLEPDFMDEGPDEILFGPAHAQPPVAAAYPVRITIRDGSVQDLGISDGRSNSPLKGTNRVDNTPGAFDCDLPAGLWEALPLAGNPPAPSPRDWFFRVTEGNNAYTF
jgi:hypothetical protein